jgi:hypothetical protein
MKKVLTYIFLFMVVLVTSCNRSVPPAEYVHYIENPSNGLKINEAVNGVTYSLQYEPVNYCVMLEKRSFAIPSGEFKKEYERFKGLEHYTFRIEKSGMDSLVNKLGDTSKYKKSVQEYFDFWIQKDIKLVKGKDTIPCSICQIDANTGISQYYTFSIGFAGDENERQLGKEIDRIFLFDNKKLHTGNINLCVKGKDLEHVPELKMM